MRMPPKLQEAASSDHRNFKLPDDDDDDDDGDDVDDREWDDDGGNDEDNVSQAPVSGLATCESCQEVNLHTC